MYSVEWQKRGLPHARILLWLEEKIHLNDIDKLISAEFPDRNEDSILYDIIKTHMLHSMCEVINSNSPCMKDGRYSKRYPKVLVEHTIAGEDGYSSYRRRSPEQGSDQATFALRHNEHDEVTRFQSGRYFVLRRRSIRDPSYYSYKKQQGVFNRRGRGRAVDGVCGIYKEHVIGRVYTVYPNNIVYACFCIQCGDLLRLPIFERSMGSNILATEMLAERNTYLMMTSTGMTL
ncbi:hypothetical protein EVAR_50894_1 [Eumeta japonica]|uniref:Uncharacterized protein n=1 Tax=Eumeta variegata TaxID=151549 RepID=A0A4C1YCL9_EUMVA|nr:hypothetical protein EVAR_50894_1 [Eumeta japonica]